MKKAIGIIILGLLWCNNVFAITQQQFIDQNLKGRKLDQIEGVWLTTAGRVFGVYKSGSQYYETIIRSTQFQSGKTIGTYSKGSETNFYGDTLAEWIDRGVSKTVNVKATISISGNIFNIRYTHKNNPTSPNFQSNRLWPEDIVSHNAKFKTIKDIADEEKVVADMVAGANKTCKVLGFKEESEKFSDCALKLYTQKVDELVAEKQAKALMTQGQTSTTTQSSGSSSVTIYDPVRDNQRLIDQGMKMLSGRCTAGVDC